MLAPMDDEYTHFKRAVGSLVPMNLDDYKRQQMERRIRDLARKRGASTLSAYSDMLRADATLLQEFEAHLTINVTEFYRNSEPFDYLTQKVLPHLVSTGKPLNIWSAGCSFGAEPLTMAMILHHMNPALRHSIHATDIDKVMLAKAREGKGFTTADVQSLPAQLRTRYITSEGAGYAVSEDIMRLVRFERHNLLKDRAPRTFDLIACRNVVIYFTDEAKERLYRMFSDGLRPGGYLFIGATEVVNGASNFGLRYVAPCFYVKDE